MKRLIVYLCGRRVGVLTQDGSGLLGFQYDSAWLDIPEAVPLSRSLPLTPEAFKGKRARHFFAGILPDEGPRRQIAAILGVSHANDFAILERIGGECAGAVSVLPEDSRYPEPGDQGVRDLGENQLEDVVAELPRRPLLAGKEGIRLSLAGTQPKLPVVVRGDLIGLPLGSTPSTHILKPEPENFPGLVANEVFCMTLARAVGLDVPAVAVRVVGQTPCMLIERYDRAVGRNGLVERLHQEDFCQAMGFPPERKYQQEGGPLVRDCVGLLRDWSTIPALDIRRFVDGLILNVLIGNADAHGKNYAMLYRAGQRRLAPLYDLVCTLAWPVLSRTPAMKIGRSESIEGIGPTHWQAMAKESRLGWATLRGRIVELSRKTLATVHDPRMRANAHDTATMDRVAAIIEKQAAATLASMTAADSPSGPRARGRRHK